MKFKVLIILSFIALVFLSCGSKKHLFILSGQSNMLLLDPDESFVPTLGKQFGKENIVVVKYAKGSQPIRRWYRGWKPLTGNEPKAEPYLYDSLMVKAHKALKHRKFATVTFIWMQGERDARMKFGEVYERSLTGLYKQLSADLGREDINFVIGRLSDFDMQNKRYLHWTMVRDSQEKVGGSNPRFAWINTDDLNDGVNRSGQIIANDLHMSAKGYNIMGKRFADKSIELIFKNR